jgi:hypothetical protein
MSAELAVVYAALILEDDNIEITVNRKKHVGWIDINMSVIG